MKRYNKTKIVGVIFVILFAILIAYTFDYVSEIRERQLSELAQGAILRAEFDFFASECLQDYDEDTIFGIYDSKWINEKSFTRGRFAWQAGYGAFSYSRSQIEDVVKYILNQQEHHKKRTFREEYVQLLKRFRIDYSDKYLLKDIEE